MAAVVASISAVSDPVIMARSPENRTARGFSVRNFRRSLHWLYGVHGGAMNVSELSGMSEKLVVDCKLSDPVNSENAVYRNWMGSTGYSIPTVNCVGEQ